MSTTEAISSDSGNVASRDTAEKGELSTSDTEYIDRAIAARCQIQMYIFEMRTAKNDSSEYEKFLELDEEAQKELNASHEKIFAECSAPFGDWLASKSEGEKIMDTYVRNHTVDQIGARDDFDSIIEAFKPFLLRSQLLKYIANEYITDQELSPEDRDARTTKLTEANRELFTGWSQSQEASALLDTYAKEHSITDIMGSYGTQKPVDFEPLVKHFHDHVPEDKILH